MLLAAHFGYRQAKRDADADRILEEASIKADTNRWPYPVIRYLRDEITTQELLTLATDGDKKTEAQAYVGMDLSLAGKQDEALIYLQWVKENGNKNFVEYSLALSEIDRIKPVERIEPALVHLISIVMGDRTLAPRHFKNEASI